MRLALSVFVLLSLLATGGVLLFAGRGAQPAIGTSGFAGSLRPAGLGAGDFTLDDQDGRRVSMWSLRGRVVVVTFLYSHCVDTCPLTATTIGGALDEVGHDVPVLAVSVDPANDTPGSAAAFLARRSMTQRMRFLLGSRATLAPIWARYGVRPQGAGFEHSASTVLIDRRGRQRVSFPVDQLTDRGLAHDIVRLEAEPEA